jgi:hypothetical protein
MLMNGCMSTFITGRDDVDEMMLTLEQFYNA